MPKIHTVGKVNFHAAGRKWTFNYENKRTKRSYSMSRDIPGGVENAERIAGYIDASFKRHPKAIEPDNVARNAMHALFHKTTGISGLARVASFPSHLFGPRVTVGRG
jgi:hypothetical protein